MDTFQVNVHLVNEDVLRMSCASRTNAEELCLKVCRELKILPTTLSLFALRVKSTGVFQPSNSIIERDFNYELRIRFKVPDLQRLLNLDLNTYNYYFLQVRADVLANRIPEINLITNKKHLLGLGVADMYRVMVEENKSFDDILNNYRKFIPKEVYNVHSIFIYKPIYKHIRKNLKQLQRAGPDTQYVKVQYLEQIHMMSPNYLTEEFSALYHVGKIPYKVRLFVSPFHEEQPGIRMHLKQKKEWVHICRIDELFCFSVKDDATVEISRKNGVPFYLKFEMYLHALSFIGVCDGYYRLMVKWTFNLCNDVVTPSLHKLKSAKCHGPVGGEFSFRKLKERCDNRPGSYILRQCQQEYDVYYLDVCSEDSSKPVIHRIEYNGYSYVMSGVEYESFDKMRAAHQDPDAHIYMKDCLPPSEYDKSPLLLCVEPPKGPSSRVQQDELETLLAEYKNPRFINKKDVQYYKGTMVESTEGAIVTYRARWHVAPSKNLDVSLKVLKKEETEEYLRDFKEQAGQWAYLKSNAVVSLYGLILLSPCAMVMEYLPYGPLDEYLSSNHDKMQVVELVEAAAALATALCELCEAGTVHGYIRCRKLLVAAHTDTHFVVKLSNPGLHSYHEDIDYHWLPPECYRNYDAARTSPYADIWAFATTLWEIFSLGLSPADTNPILTKKSYQMGNRLCNPNKCSTTIYRLMLGCWLPDPHKRLVAQGVMRDVNSQLHQVYNSRRKHEYQTVCKEVTLTDKQCVTGELEMLPASLADSNLIKAPSRLSFSDYPIDTSDIAMQCVYDLGENNTVIIKDKIGEGCYGFVHLGILENTDEGTTKTVAVKTLRSSEGLTDFLREIEIMKELSHENIVRILYVRYEPEIQLIMEYIPHGSLHSYVQIYQNKITSRHLLKFAQDIANGMHYLGTKNIVHRDLAARNILVENDNHVKISDFGLAQDTGLENFYLTKTNNRVMPLNGYAPESVIRRIFTHKSDVWSYGVTLWEIFSLGAAPPGWDSRLQQPIPLDLDLETIGRNRSSCFSCPKGCPDRVYSELLWPCLNYKPQDRPTFASLATLANQLRSTY